VLIVHKPVYVPGVFVPFVKAPNVKVPVGQCRLTVSKPVLKLPMVSALEARI